VVAALSQAARGPVTVHTDTALDWWILRDETNIHKTYLLRNFGEVRGGKNLFQKPQDLQQKRGTQNGYLASVEVSYLQSLILLRFCLKLLLIPDV